MGSVAERAPAEDEDYPQVVEVAGQALSIFAGAPALIDSSIRDIRTARSRVWIECYIFLDDEAGQAVSAALQDRARAGLDVRVLYDAVGSNSASSEFFLEMSAAGVQVHAYHTIWEVAGRHSILRFFQMMNRRNHRKIIVIDDRVAYFGGMNIVHQSNTQGARDPKPPASTVWRDIHVRLEGDQAGEVAESFERSWRCARRKSARRRSQLGRERETTGGAARCEPSLSRTRPGATDKLPVDGDFIRFFDAGPGFNHGGVASVFRQLLRIARADVLLSMAYFIPTGRIRRDLVDARRRGVRVRAIVPGDSDVKLVQWAMRHLYARPLHCGIELYERQRRMLHSKVMVIDGEWTIIGSCNLDPRSLWINLEFFAVVRSPALARKMTKICEHEIAQSQPVTLESIGRRPWWQRMLDRTAYALRRWL
jgi:cardiolipin synthase